MKKSSTVPSPEYNLYVDGWIRQPQFQIQIQYEDIPIFSCQYVWTVHNLTVHDLSDLVYLRSETRLRFPSCYASILEITNFRVFFLQRLECYCDFNLRKEQENLISNILYYKFKPFVFLGFNIMNIHESV